MSNTAFIFDPVFLEHDTGGSHPERPERLVAILQRLSQHGLLDRLTRLSPIQATREDLERVHDPAYISQVETDIRDGLRVLSTDSKPDTRIGPRSLEAALTAAGAAITAVDAVIEGRVRNAFGCVRPPGHHATRSAGMGFCIFNNVAVGVRYAMARHGVRHAAIIDWDVHHGNGTQDIFEEDPGVFLASSHQAGIYPGTGWEDDRGAGEAEGTILNMPLMPFTGEEEFIHTWRERWLPAMHSFRPDFVFISAGFDSHQDDLLGSLGVSTLGFARMTRLAMDVADEYAGGRLVSMLEGGYNIYALAESVEVHLRTLLGDPVL